MNLAELRREYHRRICQEIVRISEGKTGKRYPNFADGSNVGSVAIAWGVVKRLGCPEKAGRISGQTAGKRFEGITQDFLESAFALLKHLRPGEWVYSVEDSISEFAQYRHLAELVSLVKESTELQSSVGLTYVVTPDIVIGRMPVTDEEVNRRGPVVDPVQPHAKRTPFRQANLDAKVPLLHASVSCKWSLRSDRAQNARAEALNLIRDRKGHLPHVVAVTAEPQPTRIAALALGTGDLDCVYHFALEELEAAIRMVGNQDQLDMFNTLVDGKRLRDISDLPFDLAV
jgi:hypothetical protein